MVQRYGLLEHLHGMKVWALGPAVPGVGMLVYALLFLLVQRGLRHAWPYAPFHCAAQEPSPTFGMIALLLSLLISLGALYGGYVPQAVVARIGEQVSELAVYVLLPSAVGLVGLQCLLYTAQYCIAHYCPGCRHC